jgi:hypothetical protein
MMTMGTITNLRKNMSDINRPVKKRSARVTLSLPPDLIFAAEALAHREYSTVATICRRALADELIARGYLQDESA